MAHKRDDNDADEVAPQRASALRHVRVAELLAGAREVILDHDGTLYRLRVTSTGKLILTK